MKRSILMTSGVVALMLLLGGAAFVGGRLLSGPDLSNDKQDVIVSDSDSKAMVTSGHMIETEPAAEMPDVPADVVGLFVRREDNSLFVGTGNTSGVKVDGGWEMHHDGPVVEVVATHSTLVYRDDTLRQLGDVPPSGPIKQVLKPGSLDEIGKNSNISVWGTRRGDRVVAEVIVFVPIP